MKKKIVYNLDSTDYCNEAISMWGKNGFQYIEGSWKKIKNINKNSEVVILIVRLNNILDEEILKKFPNLKYILSASTGTDHIIFNNNKVKLISLKNEIDFLKTISSTAEFTWALILNLVRNVNSASIDVDKGNWNREKFKGFQLKNKKIGILGLGRVGSMVAKYAKSFQMKIIYYDPNIINNEYNKVDSLSDLFKESDIVTIHVPLNSKTIDLVSNEELNRINKNGIFIINTSRGKIINESAILNVLKNGSLRGIALDVLNDELINIKESILWQNRNKYNILITPHIGGASLDAMWECEKYLQQICLKNVSCN